MSVRAPRGGSAPPRPVPLNVYLKSLSARHMKMILNYNQNRSHLHRRRDFNGNIKYLLETGKDVLLRQLGKSHSTYLSFSCRARKRNTSRGNLRRTECGALFRHISLSPTFITDIYKAEEPLTSYKTAKAGAIPSESNCARSEQSCSPRKPGSSAIDLRVLIIHKNLIPPLTITNRNFAKYSVLVHSFKIFF